MTELRCLLRQRIVYGMAKADQTGLSRSGRSFIEAALILLPHTRQDATMYLSGMAWEGFSGGVRCDWHDCHDEAKDPSVIHFLHVGIFEPPLALVYYYGRMEKHRKSSCPPPS